MSLFGTVRAAAGGWQVEIPASTATALACLAGVGARPQGAGWVVPASAAPRLYELAKQFGWECAPDLSAAVQTARGVEAASRAISSDLSIKAPLGREYRPFQKAGIDFALSSNISATLIADDMGLGKQQPVDAKVLTPNGWKEIGSLRVGDKVIGSTGRAIAVTGVFPQGIKPSYRVSMSDGSSVEAGPEHLWTVGYWAGGRRMEELTLTTQQLLDRPRVEHRWADPHHPKTTLDLSKTILYLPTLSGPVEFEEAEPLPIPAYTYGMLIANGSTTSTSPEISNSWGEIRESLEAEGTKIGSVKSYGLAPRAGLLGLMPAVRLLGLDVKSASKRIHAHYLGASISDRIALLNGLMDADGTVSATGNRVVYCTTSPGLAEDIRELVEGLGGIGSVKRYVNSDPTKPIEYFVRLQLPAGVKPFRVRRKAERYQPGSHALPTRTIARVDYVRYVESVCIAVDAEDRLYATERCILTHNTVQALGYVNAIRHSQIPLSVLIVCPASLKRNWRNEGFDWLDLDIHITVVEGSRWPPLGLSEHPHVVIINYDLLVRHQQRLTERTWDILIADEAHYLNSERTQRYRAFSKIQAHRRLYLTGTPILNHPRELYPILKSLAPGICPTREEYERLYVHTLPKTETPAAGWTFTGGPEDPLRGLQTWLRQTVMIRRLKADVLPDLPPRTQQVLELPAEGTLHRLVQREHFAQAQATTSIHNLSRAVEAARASDDRRAFREAVRALRAGRRAAFREMSTIREETALAKLPLVLPLIEAGRRAGKIVVFAHHTSVLDRLQAALGPGVVRLSGGVGPGERTRAVERFQTDPTCDVFLGSLRAAGVGHTLTAAAHLIFAELDWTPGVLQQAADRIYRIGQAHPVLIQYPVLEGSIDATMAKRIVAKQDTIDRALNPEEA